MNNHKKEWLYSSIDASKFINKTDDGEKKNSPAGNRTRVSRVTGGDTDPYTTEDMNISIFISTFLPPHIILVRAQKR
jgi:hypothetical protein